MVKRLFLPSLRTGPSALNQERDDIERDEDGRELANPDQRVLFCVQKADDAAECHVYCSREKGWGDERKDTLYDKWAEGLRG